MKKILITIVCSVFVQGLFSQNIFLLNERDRFSTTIVPNQILNNSWGYRNVTSPILLNSSLNYNTFIPNTLYTPLNYGNLYMSARDLQINSFNNLNTNVIVPVIVPVPVNQFHIVSPSLPGLSNLPGTQPNLRITINN